MKKILSINVPLLKHMLIKGVENLAKKYKYIDELNVFPVPDGDTGTNMKITLEGGIDSVKEIDFEDLFMFGKNFNRGLLMNARGNSGVITSQIFKGFFKTIPESKKEINIEDIVECFKGAKEIAYKAVMNPVEGTILTVIRVISEVLLRNKNNIKTIDELMDMVVVTAEETLSTTPNILPELKEAGVVDSGGYGLCRILEGMNEALDQEIGKDVIENKEKNPPISQNKINNEKQQKFIDNNEGFGYCNEFIMTLGSKVELNQGNKTKFDLSYFKSQLNKMGDSIVTVVDDNIVKVHIHSPSP
jgi:DAK2 domain fusion protein YloV